MEGEERHTAISSGDLIFSDVYSTAMKRVGPPATGALSPSEVLPTLVMVEFWNDVFSVITVLILAEGFGLKLPIAIMYATAFFQTTRLTVNPGGIFFTAVQPEQLIVQGLILTL